MVRGLLAAVLLAGTVVGWAVAPAAADEPAANAFDLDLGAGGALDSSALDEVSGGALAGEPTDEGAWRDAEGYSYPLDIPGSVNPASTGIANSASLGASMGAHPPGGDVIPAAAGVAGDVANTIF